MLSNASIDVAFHDTYYVVGCKALNKLLSNLFCNWLYAETYILKLLFTIYALIYIDILITLFANVNLNYIYSKNNNNLIMIIYHMGIQSAENFIKYMLYIFNNYILLYLYIKMKGFSETIRQLFNWTKYIFNNFFQNESDSIILNNNNNNYYINNNNIINEIDINTSKHNKLRYKESKFNSEKDYKFWHWLAGILDGDGSFEYRKLKGNKWVTKEIRIKFHVRDTRILTRIQNYLHIGRIRYDKNKPYVIYSIGKKEDIIFVLNNINGLIKIKIDGFKKACNYLNIEFIEPNYNLKPYDPYFSGLIDTDGSIVFNYPGNRIECNLEFTYNEYTSKLNLDNVLPYYKPSVYIRDYNKYKNKSICFKYQNVKGMVFLYEYFMVNRLYSDLKFYRISKIKEFIKIRDFQSYPKNSLEYKIYFNFILDWIQYKNPLWHKTPFIIKIIKERNLDIYRNKNSNNN